MALPANEKILTLDHWKLASQIQVGDYLFDRLGRLTKVTSIQSYMPTKCYRVDFDDGLSIVGDGNLTLYLEDLKYRHRATTWKGKNKFRRPLKQIPINKLVDTYLEKRYSVPTCGALQFPTQDLPVPPFLFGYWFKSKFKRSLLSVKPEYYEFFEAKLKDLGYEIPKSYVMQKRLSFEIIPPIEQQLKPNIPSTIPDNYLMASVEQRVELLSGILMVGRRQYSVKGSYYITTQSKTLLRKLQWLLDSLGIRSHVNVIPNRRTYILTFRTWYKIHPNHPEERKRVHQARRYVNNIEEVKPQLCVHIETDSEDGSYVAAEGFITCR